MRHPFFLSEPYVKYIFYDFYDDYFLFLHDFLAVFLTILVDLLLLLLFYKDYRVVRRVRGFFLELKHSRNGAGGAEISKIRHVRPKQCRFGLSKKKIYISILVSITEKKNQGLLCTA